MHISRYTGLACLAALSVMAADKAPVFVDLGPDVSWAVLNNHEGEMALTMQAPGHWRSVFSRNGVETEIAPLTGDVDTWVRGLNDHGQVIGTSSGLCPRPFLWERGVTTPIAGCYSYPQAINNRGQIIGYTNDGGNGWRTVLWEDGKKTDIGPYETYARGINDQGQVVGYRGTSAFLWDDGSITDLPPLRGADSCGASAINKHGQIAGWCKSAGVQTVVVWDRGVPKALPLPPGSVYGYAESINAKGLVVGRTALDNLPHATIWDGENVTLVKEMVSVPQWRLQTALQVNDRGTVVGIGYTMPFTGERAFLLQLP